MFEYVELILPNFKTCSIKLTLSQMTPNHTSSFLRAGSKFKGTQQSDRQNYNVEVDIKHVDMAESELCGYLRIEGSAQSTFGDGTLRVMY